MSVVQMSTCSVFLWIPISTVRKPLFCCRWQRWSTRWLQKSGFREAERPEWWGESVASF